MLIREARDRAREWVVDAASQDPAITGAFFAGSTTWLPADAEFAPTSDVDLWLVTDAGANRHGKIAYRGVILDVSRAPAGGFRSAERILGDYHVAGAFRTPNIILDRTGSLAAVQAVVGRDYARRRWVERRCDHAAENVRRYLASLSETADPHDRVLAFLFAAGVTTHVLLVAGLRNPTVRTRYAAVRELLADYGCPEAHEELLDVLGSAHITRVRAQEHLDALAGVFDAASAALRTSVPFASDISELSRPIAIDGSRDLIDRGLHREAMFWIAVTHARCRKVLAHDAPPSVRDRLEPVYTAFLADLGVASAMDVRHRAEQVGAFLVDVRDRAASIMSANPGIKD